MFENISWLEIFKATIVTAVVGLSGYMAFMPNKKRKINCDKRDNAKDVKYANE